MKWLLQIFLAKCREFLPESRRKSNVGYRYKGKEEINMKYLQGIVGSMVSTMAVSYPHLDGENVKSTDFFGRNIMES